MICLFGGGGGGEKRLLLEIKTGWLLAKKKNASFGEKISSSNVASVTQKCLVLSDYI